MALTHPVLVVGWLMSVGVIPGFSARVLYVIIASYEQYPPENHGLGQHGLRVRRPGLLYPSPLSPGRVLGRRKDRGRHSARPERKGRSPFRPARESCGAELLGHLVPAVRGGDSFAD